MVWLLVHREEYLETSEGGRMKTAATPPLFIQILAYI